MLVLDADLGLANLDVMLNLYPKVTLHDVFTGKARLEDAILPAPGGFSVLLAGSGMVEYSRMTPEVRDQLQQVLDQVAPRFDQVLLDTGAGISDVVLYTVSLAERRAGGGHARADVADRRLRHDQGAGDDAEPAPHPPGRQPGPAVREKAASCASSCSRWWTATSARGWTRRSGSSCSGEVPVDAAVRDAVIKRQLLIDTLPGAPAAVAVTNLATRLIGA